MNRHLPLNTNLLPTGAAVFGCVGGGECNGLPFALYLSSHADRHQGLCGDADQVHPGEGAT